MKRLITFLVCLSLLLPILPVSAKTERVKGVWVSTVANLDFPSRKGLSKQNLMGEIDKIVSTCKENDINTIFFQVRPNSDALYKSSVFPWSEVLSGTQGVAPSSDFDPLEYFIKKAHTENIELHAWINPYRIGDLSKATDKNPAKQHPEYVVTCADGKSYYNPALPEVRALVLDGVSEIIENYDVDGIHFDDYFYPYNTEVFPDDEAFAKYGKDFANIADFRRNNVNILVKQVRDLVHKKDKNLKFGISPFGIWDNKRDNPLGSDTKGMSSYSEIFADSRYWVTENLVDYICPQIYWSFENTAAPFDKVLDWWNELCKNSKTELYVGLALYKQGTDEAGWQDKEQILRQITLCETKSSVKGTVFFRYGNIATPVKYDKPETIAPVTPATSSSIKITGPVNNYKTEASKCSVTGMADPSRPLYVNGTSVKLTSHGYFAACLSLKTGANTFTFTDGKTSKSITVYRVKKSAASVNNNLIKSVYPEGKVSFYSGEAVSLLVTAEKDSKVFAKIDGKEYEMNAVKEGRYELIHLLPFSEKTTVEFIARKGNKEYSFPAKTEIYVLTCQKKLYCQTECYVYDSANGGSMMDNYQCPKGSELWITAETDDMYRLSTGKWIYKTDTGETKPETKADIDTSKYAETLFSFKKPCTYQCDVTENGQLTIEFTHAPNDAPRFSEPRGVNVRAVKNLTRTKAVLSLSGTEVTGFYVSKADETNEISVYLYNNRKNGLAGKVIVLDVGHGGDDPGAYGPPGSYGATEDDLNLSVAKILANKLEKAGAKVHLTRQTDKTLLLKDRAELIRSYNPDICVSIHHNSVAREDDFNTASGLLTLYSRETSKPLAEKISKTLNKGTGVQNIGFKTQSLNVCRDYRFPCVLLECGFICNPNEYEKLLTDNYKNTLCNNIVLSISNYFS